MRTLFLFVSVLLTTTWAQADRVTLVKDHRPNATIVVPQKAARMELAAARDLQHYVEKISGVKIPLVNDGQPAAGVLLHVGTTAASQESDLPSPQSNPESYSICVRDNAVFFNARYPSPTAFAVYDFLHQQLGVRWFAPGEDWEYVPRNQSGTLEVEVDDKSVVPQTSPRVWAGHDWNAGWKSWLLRNKAVQSERVPRRNFQNNIYHVFPQSQYAKTNPEYYPLVNGKRWFPASDSYRYWWPSMGHKDVQRVTVEYMRKWFDDNPHRDSFALGMDDIAYMCSCDLCRAMDHAPDDYENRRFSSRFYKFVNIVAGELKKTHPDKYIGVLVYNIARELPPDVPKLEDNVFGYLTENSSQWFDEETKKVDQALTREWRKRLAHLSRYDYFGMTSFAPRVYPHLIEEQLKFDKSLGVEGMYVESYTFLPHTAPMIWAFARMQWDSSQDMGGLLNEFYQKMYGAAAPTMKQYFELLEKSWNEKRPGHHGWVHRDIVRQAVSISPVAARQGMDLLDRAFNQAQTEVVKRRIGVARAGLRYADYAISGYDLARQISAASPRNQQEADLLMGKIIELDQLTSRRDLFWQEAMKREDLLGENLRGFKALDSFQTNTAELDQPAAAGMLNLVNWYNHNAPEQLEKINQQILTRLTNEELKNTFEALSQVSKQRLQSWIVNPNFTDRNAKQVVSAEVDWQVQGVPNGWALWGSYAPPKVQVVKGYQQRNGVLLHSPEVMAGENKGYFMQNIPVKKGRRYVATVWTRTRGENASYLNLRFRTATGFAKGPKTTFTTKTFSRAWQQLAVTVEVPEDVTAVAFMLGTDAGEAEFSAPELLEIANSNS